MLQPGLRRTIVFVAVEDFDTCYRMSIRGVLDDLVLREVIRRSSDMSENFGLFNF